MHRDNLTVKFELFIKKLTLVPLHRLHVLENHLKLNN